MNSKIISTIVIIIGITTMLSVNAADKPQKLVDYVDIQRFMGDWYVISSIPTMFEKGAVNAIETYTWNEKKGIVDVGFTYRKDSQDGPVKNMTQRGFIYDTESNAEWRVQPLWPLKLGYLIIDLADDYSYTVVGVPNRNYLWIMARETSLSDSVYQGILDRVAEQGYDLNAIQMVPQIWD